jgi:hypothetical protein
MVVRIITEATELEDRPPRKGLVSRFMGRVRRTGPMAVLAIALTVVLAYLLVQANPQVPTWFRPRAQVRIEAPVHQIDARMEEALRRIETATQERLKTINSQVVSSQMVSSQVGGLPSTDRPAPAPRTPDGRPWVIHGEGIGTIDSRSPEVSKATEIYIGTDISGPQVDALAARLNEQVSPKLDDLVAKVDSRLDEKLAVIGEQHKLTAEQMSLLRAELTRSVGVILKEEMTRNQELWRDNVTYRILYHRSLDLNQDLFALYAGKVKDDHALGNIAKVVPKLFTLQVWQNKDQEDQYTVLLSRYQELLADSQQVKPQGQN